ncbi:hypothetical protein G7066_00940 [Leucobacter coleopterorum]|uniref:Uncharacterized protein n=1 Tax=Leucobacter coleopterorum TaxID=2714933 RepID=A0ABX6JTM2_9MICO|nr:hypothetical protein [Leucobacter coleopterorum]QIM17634.1 hypothetical protein G7066_00940 [Leucobacter coleopterorum]
MRSNVTVAYDFDFTTLEGGALPAGAVLSANDVDTINGDGIHQEQVSFNSPGNGDWLKYHGVNGPLGI